MNDKALSNYGNPDNDPRGLWKSDPAHAQGGHGTKNQFYTLVAPNGKLHEPPSGRCWLYTKDVMDAAIKDNRIWFGVDGNAAPRIKTFLNAKDRGLTPETILFSSEASTNEKAKNSLKELFDGYAVFETPKPVELISILTRVSCKEGIVMDFFSGSAATANAVLQLNAEDKFNRQYIMVQLPEETDTESEAFKAGYKNICEIGKERIRRAGKKIKEEHPEAKDLDVGFRVLKCDESNMKDVYFSPKELQQGMLDFMEDNIKEDRSDLDLLFDCMLRWGVELSLPMTTTQVDGCTIHNVNDGDLLACFAGTITDKVISAIAAQHPLRIVFRDSSFTSASQKMNLFEQFKQLLSWSDQEVRNNVKVI